MTESLEWIDVLAELPYDELTVLIAFTYAPTWIGYHDGDIWIDAAVGFVFEFEDADA